MKLEWMADSIGDRKSWVLRDLDDGGRPKASITPVSVWHQLVVVGGGYICDYNTADEAKEVGSMLATKSQAEIAAYKIAIRRLT